MFILAHHGFRGGDRRELSGRTSPVYGTHAILDENRRVIKKTRSIHTPGIPYETFFFKPESKSAFSTNALLEASDEELGVDTRTLVFRPLEV